MISMPRLPPTDKNQGDAPALDEAMKLVASVDALARRLVMFDVDPTLYQAILLGEREQGALHDSGT